MLVAAAAAQIGHNEHSAPPPARQSGPIGELLRRSKTEEARKEITRRLQESPGDAELYYQLARSYLLDFYENGDPAKARTALALAMEALSNTLQRNSDHIPALKAKAIIHARAELLYYDPNLAYQMAEHVAKLQPSASEYFINVTEWLSGEVRFTAESEHRVPHDPLLGLDRSIQILDRVIDSAMPYSNEEGLALYGMAKSLAKRGNHREAVEYFELALSRPANNPVRTEILREMGVSQYRSGNFAEAARSFYRVLAIKPDLADQWLMKVTLDAWKDDTIRLPEAMRFPTAPKAETGSIPGLAFRDIAPNLGLDRFDGNGTCGWADFDGDGKLDVALAGSGTFLGLYKNEGEKFREVTAAAGLDRVPSGYSLNWVDYDNDGKLDLYLALNGWSGPMPNRLYQNLGDGKFQDVSAASGAADSGSGFVSLWGDLNNDGLLDLAVANGVLKDGSVPQIYRNNGDGTFRNVTREAGLNEPPTYGAIGIALGDYDRDGDLDLFINGLQSAPNRLYRNDGDLHFTDVTKQAGVDRQPAHNGFVAFFTDYNNDAWPDLLVASLAPWDAVLEGLKPHFTVSSKDVLHPDATRLFRNNRNGTFTDVTAEAGLGAPMGVMGAGVADIDNDGYVDFYFGVGDPQLSRLEPNRFYHNNGDGTFSDVTTAVGFAHPGNKGHGVCFVDIDEDGDLDVYAQLGGHYPGDHARNAFCQNLKGNGNNWLQVDLEGVKSNRYAVGTQMVLRGGGLTVYREVKGSEGFGSTSPYRQHFGLGKTTGIDSLEVIWPSGLKQQFKALKVNQAIAIREGEEPPRVIRK